MKHIPADWKCPECGSADRRHIARGLCKVCYARWFRRVRQGRKPNLAGKFHECVKCGASPVKALGMCNACYNRMLEQKNIARRRIQKYRAGERFRFGGEISVVNRACEVCGLTNSQSLARWGRKLDVHHKDGNGRTSAEPNHNPDNLRVLCRECHMSVHHPEGEPVGNRWGRR